MSRASRNSKITKQNVSIASGIAVLVVIAAGAFYLFATVNFFPVVARGDSATSTAPIEQPKPQLDKAAYDAKLLSISNLSAATLQKIASSTAFHNTLAGSTTPIYTPLWPVKTNYPEYGALLPFNRIVAYYGNFYSTGMGVLGEYPEAQMLSMLASTTAQWQAADPSTPVIPAIDYIAVTAQGSAGADGMYRARMPDSQLDYAESLANKINGLMILDVQVGLSNVQTEVPLLKKYLEMPNVELALDPEFAMQTSGEPPGDVVGTLDAKDINWAANYLAQLVDENNLPPKILIVHRFTQAMVTNTDAIQPLPQVQIVMDMDGWGSPAKKETTYADFIAGEPVQFTGFKLFYKNDLKPPSPGMMTPQQVLQLTPNPSFIQYQ